MCDYKIEVIIPKLTHTHASQEPIRENYIAPTCTEGGSFDLVTYCSKCHEELERNHIEVEKLGQKTRQIISA